MRRLIYLFDAYPVLSETFLQRELNALIAGGLGVEVWSFLPGPGATLVPGRRRARLLTVAGRQAGDTARARMWWRALQQVAPTARWHVHATWASRPAAVAARLATLGKPGQITWSCSGHARDLFVEHEGLGLRLESCVFATACTRAGLEQMARLAPSARDRLHLVPHGLPLEDFPYLPADPGLNLLFAGRLVHKKGFDLLLQALHQLRHDCPEITVRVAGSGPCLEEWRQLTHQLGLEARVCFLGAIPFSVLQQEMRAAAGVVLPSRVASDGDRDGLPNVLLEAAALGVPVIASRAGAIEEFFGPETAWLFAPDDAAALAATLNEWAAHPAARAGRLALARRRVEERADLSRTILPLRDLLQRALES